MFCPNCGKQLPDGTKFCSRCGKDLTKSSNEHTTSGTKQNSRKVGKGKDKTKVNSKTNNWFYKKKDKYKSTWQHLSERTRRAWIISISVVLAIAIIVAIVVPVAQAQNDKKHIMDPVNREIEFYNKRSTDMETYYHNAYFPYYSDSEYEQVWPQQSQFKDLDSEVQNLQESYNYADASWGKDWKITVTVRDQRKLEKSEYHSLITRMAAAKADDWNDIENQLENPDVMSSRIQAYNSKHNTHLRESSFREYLKTAEKALNRVVNPKIQKAYLVKAHFSQKGSKNADEFDFSFYSVKVDGVWFGIDTKTYEPTLSDISCYYLKSVEDGSDEGEEAGNEEREDQNDDAEEPNDVGDESDGGEHRKGKVLERYPDEDGNTMVIREDPYTGERVYEFETTANRESIIT